MAYLDDMNPIIFLELSFNWLRIIEIFSFLSDVVSMSVFITSIDFSFIGKVLENCYPVIYYVVVITEVGR